MNPKEFDKYILNAARVRFKGILEKQGFIKKLKKKKF